MQIAPGRLQKSSVVGETENDQRPVTLGSILCYSVYIYVEGGGGWQSPGQKFKQLAQIVECARGRKQWVDLCKVTNDVTQRSLVGERERNLPSAPPL